MNQEDPVPDEPQATLVSPLRLHRLAKELGPGCLGVAFLSIVADLIDFLADEVAALLQVDSALNKKVLKRPKVHPRTLLPKDYHNYLDLCKRLARNHVRTGSLRSTLNPT